VAGAHLPQPEWFSGYSVEAEEQSPSSTLHLYRRALRTRRRLQAAESLEWLDGEPSVVAFQRPGGWISVTNFGAEAVPMPAGTVVLTSGPLAAGGLLPADTTAWLVPADAAARLEEPDMD
jgi:alpha-glucosidase